MEKQKNSVMIFLTAKNTFALTSAKIRWSSLLIPWTAAGFYRKTWNLWEIAFKSQHRIQNIIWPTVCPHNNRWEGWILGFANFSFLIQMDFDGRVCSCRVNRGNLARVLILVRTHPSAWAYERARAFVCVHVFCDESLNRCGVIKLPHTSTAIHSSPSV